MIVQRKFTLINNVVEVYHNRQLGKKRLGLNGSAITTFLGATTIFLKMMKHNKTFLRI
jgi:hypothetical protein